MDARVTTTMTTTTSGGEVVNGTSPFHPSSLFQVFLSSMTSTLSTHTTSASVAGVSPPSSTSLSLSSSSLGSDLGVDPTSHSPLPSSLSTMTSKLMSRLVSSASPSPSTVVPGPFTPTTGLDGSLRSSTLDTIVSTPASKSSSWSWSMLKRGLMGGGSELTTTTTSVNSTISESGFKTTPSSSLLTMDYHHHHGGGGGGGGDAGGFELTESGLGGYYEDLDGERAGESARTVSQVALGSMKSFWRKGSRSVSTLSPAPLNLTSINATDSSGHGAHGQNYYSDSPSTKNFVSVGVGVGGSRSEEEGGGGSGWFSGVSQNVTSSFSRMDPESLFLYEQEDPLSLPMSSLILNNSSSDNSSFFYGGFNDTGFDNETGIVDPGFFQYNYWALLLIVFPVFTVFGNVLVILSVKRERSLHNVTNYFIVSLAVADVMVAGLVMPFGVYFLFLNMTWELPPIFCDFYIAMDVMCSTSSICNLVAISIDRFIAVTRPIKYAKPKSTTRVWLTIVIVWVFSTLVGSPIVLGLNNPGEGRDETDCSFHNKYFVLVSSLCSFYIPCSILVFLYYRIFKVIRGRAKKAVGDGGGGRKAAGSVKGGTVIENLAQTKRLADTGGGSSTLPIPKSNNIDENDEKLTNTGSGSQEDGDDLDKDDGDLDAEVDAEDVSPDSDDCHIIPNNQATTSFIISEAAKETEMRNAVNRGNVEPNGNHDSGYAPSNMDDALAPGQEPSPASPKLSLVPPDQCKRNGLSSRPKCDEPVALISPGEVSTGSNKKPQQPASRFTICKVHKASRKKREKSSAKRERKATKTLAIVLGLFLLCWLPFFTCNIMDALCSVLNKNCSPSLPIFLTTTWLGYINSCLNPVIYTIFNPEFRKAFKNLLQIKRS